MLCLACSSDISGDEKVKDVEYVEKDASELKGNLKLELISEEKAEKTKKIKLALVLENSEINISGLEIKIEYFSSHISAVCKSDNTEKYLLLDTDYENILMNNNNILLTNTLEKEGFILVYSLDSPLNINGNLGEFCLEINNTNEYEIEISDLKITEITDDGMIISYDKFPKSNYREESE